MSAELLVRPEEEKVGISGEIGLDETKIIGRTVFEALAVDSATAIEAPEGIEDARFTRSLTRIPGGQTVPDDR